MRVMFIHFLVALLEHLSNKMAGFLFESLQMDSRYRIWPRMYRLGIWVSINVYLFVWINSKSTFEHLIVFL
jgi:hypothetical protein